MDNPAQLRIEISRFWLFAYSSRRNDGLAHHNNRIDDHAGFSYFVYVVRIIAALSTTGPSDRLQNMVQTFFSSRKTAIFRVNIFAIAVLALRTKCQSMNNMIPPILVSLLWQNRWLILVIV